jgi:hypothetical protein
MIEELGSRKPAPEEKEQLRAALDYIRISLLFAFAELTEGMETTERLRLMAETEQKLSFFLYNENRNLASMLNCLDNLFKSAGVNEKERVEDIEILRKVVFMLAYPRSILRIIEEMKVKLASTKSQIRNWEINPEPVSVEKLSKLEKEQQELELLISMCDPNYINQPRK